MDASGSANTVDPTTQPLSNQGQTTVPDAQPYSTNPASPEEQFSSPSEAMVPQEQLTNQSEALNPEGQTSELGHTVNSEEQAIEPSQTGTVHEQAIEPSGSGNLQEQSFQQEEAELSSPADPIGSTGASPGADPASTSMGVTEPTGTPDSTVSQSQTNSSQPTSSFVDSPNHTPIQAATPTPQPSTSEQKSSVSERRTGEQDEERIALAQLAAPHQWTPSTKLESHSEWAASEQVGATLIPNVSLLATAIW